MSTPRLREESGHSAVATGLLLGVVATVTLLVFTLVSQGLEDFQVGLVIESVSTLIDLDSRSVMPEAPLDLLAP